MDDSFTIDEINFLKNELQNFETFQRGRYMNVDIDVITESGDISNELLAKLEDLIRDKAKAYYRQLQERYEYELSDECCIEFIEANDYEFLENGDFYYERD